MLVYIWCSYSVLDRVSSPALAVSPARLVYREPACASQLLLSVVTEQPDKRSRLQEEPVQSLRDRTLIPHVVPPEDFTSLLLRDREHIAVEPLHVGVLRAKPVVNQLAVVPGDNCRILGVSELNVPVFARKASFLALLLAVVFHLLVATDGCALLVKFSTHLVKC